MGELNPAQKRGNADALLPILVFLVLYLGCGLLFEYGLKIEMGFYQTPAIVAFLIALFVACVQNRALDFNAKLKVMANGVADENILTMCLVFLAAGAFSGAVQAAGGADSTVYLFLDYLPSQFAVAGLFLISCFVSISMGTSVGTISALAPFAVSMSEATGFEVVLCIAAVASGAMFGDNLSMISDTTIAAVRTQGCEMKDKFRMNFFIVLPAAILTLVIFIALTWGGSGQPWRSAHTASGGPALSGGPGGGRGRRQRVPDPDHRRCAEPDRGRGLRRLSLDPDLLCDGDGHHRYV